jgi:hypothetical protein
VAPEAAPADVPASLRGPAEPSRGIVGADQLLEPARAGPRGGCNLSDRQTGLAGFDNGQDPLLPAFFDAVRGEGQAIDELLLAPDRLADGPLISISSRVATPRWLSSKRDGLRWFSTHPFRSPCRE